MRRLLPLVMTMCAACAIVACEDEHHTYVDNVLDPEHTPTMVTTDVTTLISDSGYMRYRITSPVWYVFDEADTPKWTFPKGLHLKQYDLQFKPSASVDCDSAVYFSQRRLWRLDGHVVMVNAARDSFLTHQLYWDQPAGKIYSDSFMHIVRQDRVIEGYGFEANEQMTEYVIRKPQGIIPIEDPRQRQSAPGTMVGVTDPNAPLDDGMKRLPAPVRASQRQVTFTTVSDGTPVAPATTPTPADAAPSAPTSTQTTP